MSSQGVRTKCGMRQGSRRADPCLDGPPVLRLSPFTRRMRRVSLRTFPRRSPSRESCGPYHHHGSGRGVQARQQSSLSTPLASILETRSGHDPLPRIKDILADLNRSTSRVHLPLTTISAKAEFGRVVSRMLTAAMTTEPTGPTTRSYLTPTGLRKIEPYWYPYTTMAKGRWLGREMLEVVSTEFRDRSIDYYVSPKIFVQGTQANNDHAPVQRYALESGVTTINGEIAKPDTIIRNGDRIEFGVLVCYTSAFETEPVLGMSCTGTNLPSLLNR